MFASITESRCRALPSAAALQPAPVWAGDYGLVITAGGSVAAVILPNSNTTAGAYLAVASPTSKALLPVVQRNMGGWNASTWLQSISASSATLHFYAVGSGALAATQSVTVTAGATTRIDAVSVASLADGQAYSVVIDGTGTIAAAVAEFNPSPGDGLMIYEAFAQ